MAKLIYLLCREFICSWNNLHSCNRPKMLSYKLYTCVFNKYQLTSFIFHTNSLDLSRWFPFEMVLVSTKYSRCLSFYKVCSSRLRGDRCPSVLTGNALFLNKLLYSVGVQGTF